MSTVILKTAARILVPISLIFAAFLYFKGHQSPGGGFVGGLAAAVALIVHRMSHGRASLMHMMRIKERNLIAIGLALALSTAIIPLLLGKQAMFTVNGYVPLPGSGGDTFHLASVMVFDLGVFLVVCGVVVGMINALSEELE